MIKTETEKEKEYQITNIDMLLVNNFKKLHCLTKRCMKKKKFDKIKKFYSKVESEITKDLSLDDIAMSIRAIKKKITIDDQPKPIIDLDTSGEESNLIELKNHVNILLKNNKEIKSEDAGFQEEKDKQVKSRNINCNDKTQSNNISVLKTYEDLIEKDEENIIERKK